VQKSFSRKLPIIIQVYLQLVLYNNNNTSGNGTRNNNKNYNESNYNDTIAMQRQVTMKLVYNKDTIVAME